MLRGEIRLLAMTRSPPSSLRSSALRASCSRKAALNAYIKGGVNRSGLLSPLIESSMTDENRCKAASPDDEARRDCDALYHLSRRSSVRQVLLKIPVEGYRGIQRSIVLLRRVVDR